MTKKLIVQIGRLDRGYIEEKEFIYNGKNYCAPLSSFALREYYRSDSSKVFIFYPISLPLNKTLATVGATESDCFLDGVKELLYDSNRKEDYFKYLYIQIVLEPNNIMIICVIILYRKFIKNKNTVIDYFWF